MKQIANSLWVACLLNLACTQTQEHERSRLCAAYGCSESCQKLDVEACDVADEACRDVVFQSLLCVRGGRLSQRPDTQVNGEPEQDAGAPPEPAPPPRPPPPGYVQFYRALDQAKQLLHIQATEQTFVQAQLDATSHFVGEYEPSSGTVSVMTSGDVNWNDMLLLAHEYTHALQDAEAGAVEVLKHRLAEDSIWSGQTSAKRQVINSFVEGEAELYAFLTYAFMRRLDIDQWAMDDYLPFRRKRALSKLTESKSTWASAEVSLNYPVGFEYLWGLWQNEAHSGVRAAARSLPGTIGFWLDGYPVADSLKQSLRRGLRYLPAQVPAGYSQLIGEELGPGGVAALATSALDRSAGLPLANVWQLMRAARGDRLRIYAQSDATIPPNLETHEELIPDGNVGVEWCLKFEDEDSAKLLAAAVTQFSELSVERRGSLIVLTAQTQGLGVSFAVSSCE